jgi:hypothetical protein
LSEEQKKKPDLDLMVFVSASILSIYPWAWWLHFTYPVFSKSLKRIPWPQSASKLYRLSNLCLSMKLCQFLRIEGVMWSAQRIRMAMFSAF